MAQIEIAILAFSTLFGDLVFSHREDVSRKYLHTEIAFDLPSMLV